MERKKSSSHRKPSSAAQQPNFTNISEYPHKEPEFVPPSPLKSHTKPIIERAIESTTPNPVLLHHLPLRFYFNPT